MDHAAPSSSTAIATPPLAQRHDGPPPPRLRELLTLDLQACNGRSGGRAMLAALVYEPGFSTVAWHRVAQRVQAAGWRRLAKLIWRFNTAWSSCHLHLDARLGGGLHLPHPAGIVVGAGVELGRFVTLYQHSTVGRNLRDPGYPRLGTGVTVFPGATVIGSLDIEAGVTIGAGTVVSRSLPAGVVVAGNPARIVRYPRPTDTPAAGDKP
ncbi:MAG: hypothetical protein DI603_11465 [Roseateles depolymerans]|uniref:Serine acetyltransferase n=1 Tax=Roseateles depolymerans TaxID=76731 RepID=A0A2W5DMX6_9BURK|nr:MAG: hypothetical protein DI603_11465 [Roseateles depolymerans]